MTQFFDQPACIDTHRAACCTEAIGGTGFNACITVSLCHFCGTFAVISVAFQLFQFPPGGDTLARAEAEVPRWAVNFAESAFDALVDNWIRLWQGFQVF